MELGGGGVTLLSMAIGREIDISMYFKSPRVIYTQKL
jgi:hypothetical protein